MSIVQVNLHSGAVWWNMFIWERLRERELHNTNEKTLLWVRKYTCVLHPRSHMLEYACTLSKDTVTRTLRRILILVRLKDQLALLRISMYGRVTFSPWLPLATAENQEKDCTEDHQASCEEEHHAPFTCCFVFLQQNRQQRKRLKHKTTRIKSLWIYRQEEEHHTAKRTAGEATMLQHWENANIKPSKAGHSGTYLDNSGLKG